MMTFREALEKEIAIQGISVAEVVQKSGLSKGAVYNILNGTTEESRIRVATKRALARGCGKDLRILPDGGVTFVAPESEGAAQEQVSPELSSDITLRFLSYRPFFSQSHVAEAFDWLYAQEENEALSGLNIVDRVFQRREDFLSVEAHNISDEAIKDVRFEMNIAYADGPKDQVICLFGGVLAPRERMEYSLFVMSGPAYELTLQNGTFTTAGGQVIGMAALPTFQFKGDLA